MDSTIFDFDRIREVDLKKTMEDAYIDYSMSVITARAIPDVRDGLKPVQRRILFSMDELNVGPDKPHRKSARIVGDTMGKYHPHGDSSIYEAMVKLAQPFNTRYPLVDGHGNFGSIDGDGAAASRYTEARLSKISVEMLADIGKDTVDFAPNYDDSEKEPTVLPSRFPNLLVNGGSGIAVGMATNIPPHNLREVIGAVVRIIDNRVAGKGDTSVDELMEIIKGPDFPTGAMIVGHKGIEDAYRTGRGKVVMKAISEIEPMPNGKQKIIFTEIPYMVNKARLIEKIGELYNEKKLDGITDLRDESDRTGMRIVVELRRDVNANVILNKLYKHTQLMDTFGVINLALVDGEPKVLNLEEMLTCYLAHQEEVVTRRTRYDLNKAEERAHIVEGLLIALDNIDEVIRIIRASESAQEAKNELIARFDLDDVQAQAIIDMRLRALTGLEREKLENEFKELQLKISELKAILADENKLLLVIKEELQIIAEKYGDDRRTVIGADEGDMEISMEDIIPNDPAVITLTKLGYIKRMSDDNFKAQNRGGKGIKGMTTIEDDYLTDMIMTTNHNPLLFFTNLGRVYKLKAYEIPEAGRTARGTFISNLLHLVGGEKVTSVIPAKQFYDGCFLFMATKKGIVKKTSLSDMINIRTNGLRALNFKEDEDELVGVKFTNGERDIFLATKKGMLIRFSEKDVRPMGRDAGGVIGVKLDKDDEVIGIQLDTDGEALLFVSERGMGKRTSMDEFSPQHRGGKGVKCYKIMPRTKDLVAFKAVRKKDEIMIITTEGVVIRMKVSQINKLGRITSGVRLINIDNSVSVASVSIVVDEEEEKADEQLMMSFFDND
ncbi:MAG: DNA gyrase subunit A [Lachnospiraceae bacterium]|nr:DNA gyrase subunit A [Lachnospiraceae bacterium]